MTDDAFSVYRFYGADNDLLYVGLTGRGVDRLKQHSLASEWWGDVIAIGVEHFPNKRAAYDRETYLIEELKPRYNRRVGGIVLPLPDPPVVPAVAA